MESPSPPKRNPLRDTWTWDRRFRSIFDSALDAVVTMGIDGNVIDWNKQAEVCFGWTRDEAAGRPLADLIVPEEFRQAHREGLERYRRTGEGTILNQRIEMSAVSKDGTTFPVELSITPVEIGPTVIFNAFVRNISDRKRDEERRSRETLEARLLHQAATLSLSDRSFDEALHECVSIICDVMGWPVGHVLLLDNASRKLVSSRIWHLDDAERFGKLREISERTSFSRGSGLPGLIWETREPIWIDNVYDSPSFPRAEGEPELGIKGAFGFPVVCGREVVAVLEFFSDGDIVRDPRLAIMIRSIGNELGNVIERRRWQEDLSRMASIVESSNDAIIAKSLDGRIISWNRGAERIYGYAAVEVIGKPITTLIPEGLDDEEPEVRDVIRLGTRLEHFETRRRRKNGQVMDVSITVSAIRDSDGEIVGSSTIERDVTQRIQRERELEAAKDAAESANRAKGEFLANISHELRTPMNAILGMLELALGEALSDVMKDYLKTAHDSARTLLFLLNDLLDYSRLEAGRFELEKQPFHLRSLLDATMKLLSLRANEKGLELACHIAANVPDRLSGDANRLKQVLVNLVGNAVKFTDQGEIVVNVQVTSKVDGEAVVEIAVADTGIGISKDDQERIFAPFTQADASTTRRFSGTGLGLAICHELVDRMGGRLWLESEPGTGSRFHFTVCLPVLADDRGSLPRLQERAGELLGLPVLVVDDNETNRQILEEILTSWHMTPTAAADGKSALKRLAESADDANATFQVVLVDALMPEMDGFMFIEEARRLGVLQGATVLMLSSSDRQTFYDRCEDVDVNTYLEKPVSQSDLLDAILTALYGPAMDRGGDGPATTDAVRPLRILLAEDTLANRKVITAILEKRGHKVAPANNGRETVELMWENEFDVVLMDVQMPTMDGFQATAAIRDFNNGAAKTPIVAMTAHAMRGDRERCLEAGMDAYLPKPIDAQKLIETVESLGSKRRGEPAPRTERPPPGNGAPADKASGLIAREAVLKRLGGDEDLLQDMLRFFLEDAPELLDRFRDAIRGNAAGEAERAAHSLKGLAANLGAHSVVELAHAAEAAGRDGDGEQLQELLPPLERNVRYVLDEIERSRS